MSEANGTIYDVEVEAGMLGSPLYAPKSTSKMPAILVLHGSEGGLSGWNQWQALRFAMHGFVVIAPNYSVNGNSWHAGNIEEIDLELVIEAMDWLRGHTLTNGKVGLFGASRGAEMALLLASLMERDGVGTMPDAVVVHAPSDTIAGAFIAGTYHPKEKEAWDPAKRAWRWKGTSESLLPTTPIEIERYDGPIFISHGDADELWTVNCTRRLEARLRSAGRAPEVLIGHGEGHSFRRQAYNSLHEKRIKFLKKHLLG